MTSERNFGGTPFADAEDRSWARAMRRGFSGACPRCGEGRLLRSYLKVRPSCESCGLDLSGHRADDLPPYLTIFIVGHLLIPGVLLVERVYAPSQLFSVLLWSAVALFLSLILLPRMKGAVIGLQWAHGMHGFGAADGWAERPAPGADEDEIGLAEQRGGATPRL